MALIDKTLYTTLKKWCDHHEAVRPKNQNIIFVNSHDRELTNTTIRKSMFELMKEDIYGEVFISIYSADNFYKNMHKYFSHISELYMNPPNDGDSVIDIINNLPPTCGWIVLVIEDIEAFSGDSGDLNEMYEAIIAFASKKSDIIFVGKEDNKQFFSGCEIGLYNQEESPNKESVIYEIKQKKCDELNFYWNLLYKQLENNYFDYSGFKNLYKETLEYIIPRVTKQKVYRRDITLIENIGAMRNKKPKDIDGCKPWEFDAARQFANGLHHCIEYKSGDKDDISAERIGIDVVEEHRREYHGSPYISEASHYTIELSIDTVCAEMDFFAESIFNLAYEGREIYEALKRVR